MASVGTSIGRLEILILKDGMIVNAVDYYGYSDPITIGMREGLSGQDGYDKIANSEGGWDSWVRQWYELDEDEDEDALTVPTPTNKE